MRKIAIVEDNADNRLLVQAILDGLYETSEYVNGSEALSGMEQEKPDLVLLDISLPGMDGKEVLQRIRADDSLHDIPVIALTAHAMAGDKAKFLALGFNAYVAKPIIDEQELLGAIEHLIA